MIDVPSLKNKIRMNSSRYETRNRNVVLIDNHTTNYGLNAPIYTRLLGVYNENYDNFEQSRSSLSFKSSFKRILHV